jgi:integrase
MPKRERKQIGYVYRRANWWVLRYRIEVPDGESVRTVQRAKRLTPVDAEHRTKASVIRLAEEALQRVNQQRHSSELAARMGDFVTRIYLPHVADQKRASTYHDYKNRWNQYLADRCAGWWLREIRTCDVQRLLQEIAEERKIGKATLRHIKALLSGIVNHARQQGFFDGANPVQGVSIPKCRRGGETYAYTLEEVMRIVSALPQPAATITATAAFTGLRRGELQGLLWENYNGKELRITRSIWFGIADEPKTPRSKAAVPVITPLREMLDAFRTTCGSPPTGPMFANSEGHPMCLNNLTNRCIQPRFEFCKQCGKPRIGHNEDHRFHRDDTRREWHGWHAFRRGLATNLYRLGVQDKVIQAILRHSNLTTTMNAYVKSVDADSVKAMKALEKVTVRLIVRRQLSRNRKGRKTRMKTR